MKSENTFNHLKKDVERKFGNEIKYSKQCQLLAETIFKSTGKRLSVSTVKRAFGIIQSSFKPSRYTLDTFAHYAGFDNWNLYLTRESELIQEEYTHSMNDSIDQITENSLHLIHQKTGYDSRKFIKRAFATRYLENFLHSERPATMLVAPKGYGKSSILMQWFGNHRSAASYSHNKVCLIDGGIYFAIYNMSQHSAILDQLIDFNLNDCPGLFMKSRMVGETKRYIIVIDDIDEVFLKKDRYHNFVRNIMQILLMNKDNPNFKMIFTCRPENLDPFESHIVHNPILADLWYHVHFFSHNHLKAINVPLYNHKELKVLLKSIDDNFYNYCILKCPDIIELICNPHFFNITKDQYSLQGFSELSYLDFLIQKIIYSPPYTTEKQMLVKTFFRLCRLAVETDFAEKDLLIEEPNCLIAYNELLASGVLYESFETNNSFDVRIKVRFSNKRIFEHLLLRYITQDSTPDLTFIKKSLHQYNSNPASKSGVVSGLIKYAFALKDYNLAKHIYKLEELLVQDSGVFGHANIREYNPPVLETLITCLRNDKSSREVLLPWLAESHTGRMQFYEELFDMDNLKDFPLDTLSLYHKNNPSLNGKVIASFIVFIKGFCIHDKDSCKNEWEKVQNINPEELTDPVAIRNYFSMAFISKTYFARENCDDLLSKVLIASKSLREKSIQKVNSIPYFELTVLIYLNICNQYQCIHSLSEHVDSNYFPSDPDRSCYWQYYKLCRARAHLHTENPAGALELYRQHKDIQFPVHLRKYMQLNTDLIKAEFHIYRKKNKSAAILLQDIKSMADFLEFKILSQRANELETGMMSKKSI